MCQIIIHNAFITSFVSARDFYPTHTNTDQQSNTKQEKELVLIQMQIVNLQFTLPVKWMLLLIVVLFARKSHCLLINDVFYLCCHFYNLTNRSFMAGGQAVDQRRYNVQVWNFNEIQINVNTFKATSQLPPLIQ